MADPDSGGFADRRLADRRDRPTRIFDGVRGPRRRAAGRRLGEQQGVYLDRYPISDVALVVVIFLLNVVDAGLTLDHLSQGAGEANPLMDALLRNSHSVFIAEKIVLVGLCLILLVAHRTFPLARRGLWLLAALYSALFVWHVVVWLTLAR